MKRSNKSDHINRLSKRVKFKHLCELEFKRVLYGIYGC